MRIITSRCRDALQKLLELGIIESEERPGRGSSPPAKAYRVVEIDDALEHLGKKWDDIFEYND